MSEADERKQEWRFHIADMIGFCERVLDYTAGMDRASFVATAMTYDAVLRNLELIGEAATHIPGSVCDAHPKFPGARSSERETASPTATC